MMKKRFLSTALCAAFFAAPTHAAAVDPLIEGAKLCTQHLGRYERQYAIPQHLLSAIASTESGRWHSGLKIAVPWPWTINAEGKGYYFDSKQEAINAAKKLAARGVKSMDVGCMQVNLYHHPEAFANLDKAFEPESNIAYASSFLYDLYRSEGTWRKAAAAYHSKTPSLGGEYVGQVFSRWTNILDKLRVARTQLASADMGAPALPKAAAPAAVTNQNFVRKVNDTTAAKPALTLGEQQGKKLAAQAPVHMKVIKVSDGGASSSATRTREKGVIIVRPVETAASQPAKPVQLADASLSSTPKVVRVNAQAAPKNGPRFIFQ